MEDFIKIIAIGYLVFFVACCIIRYFSPISGRMPEYKNPPPPPKKRVGIVYVRIIHR